MIARGLRVLVVDDERPALDDLVRALRSLAKIDVVEAAPAADAALVALAADPRLDGVFLDIRMPGLDGIELARVLRRFARPPAVVFVSAYERFAAAAFEVAAVDFLLKPVSRQRLTEAVDRVARIVQVRPPAGADGDDDVVPVDAPSGGGKRLLSRASILYIRAHGTDAQVVCERGRYVVHARLGELEERWSAHGFVRVSRGFVVNLRHAVDARPRLNGTAVLTMADGTELAVARRRARQLWERLGD